MKILIAAGGTGGHVYPALVIAKEIKRQEPKAEIVFVGTRKGFEATLVPEHGFPIEFIEIQGLKNKGLRSTLHTFFLLPKAFWISNSLLKKHSPVAVFGIGGYASGPLLLLASMKKIHTAILEPNAIAGLTNRRLGKFVEKIFVAFERSIPFFPKNKTVYSGNPIREDILNVIKPDFFAARKTIFIFGGSQGARKINQGVIEMIEKSPEEWKGFSFIHQTGPHDEEYVKNTYTRLGIDADVRKYFDHIAGAYAKSHFIIARAGSSVMEIAATGRPSVLIPFPYAADQHQMENAKILSDARAAFLIDDSECTGDILYNAIWPTLNSQKLLQDMSDCALKFRVENAASMIAGQILKWTS